MSNNMFFKYLTVFLLGLILGYLVKGINFPSAQSQSTISDAGSIKAMGAENAPVTIVEYSDFQCPLCTKYYRDTYHTILDNYLASGKVKYVFKHFPLNIHPQAPDAALASECALEQNKFWEMHDALFENQSTWSGKTDHLDTFKKLAQNLGIDTDKFNACLDSQKYRNNVEKDYQEGINRSIRGTPSFYINDRIIVGAQDSKVFTDMIEAELATAQQ